MSNQSQLIQLLINQCYTGGNTAVNIYAFLIICTRKYIFSLIRYHGFLSIVFGHSLTLIISYTGLILPHWHHCKNCIMSLIFRTMGHTQFLLHMFIFYLKNQLQFSYQLILLEIRYFSRVFCPRRLFLYLYMVTLPAFFRFLLF